ncbi:hypothetical protein Clacol_002329 [Clathrus columnatus]|uniref:RING-type domain-containing protein n=1 Tax=Clathrus columnatus TaxID=1419009 RepID=A0AAV5A6D7_9AGAM|nr:hypothetical protein Clacol_002329 [Clathrus columnatus]
MLSACFSTLKRKFFAIADECDDEKALDSQACSPRKRLRVQERASVHGTTQPTLAASDVASGEEENLPLEEVDEEETVEELEAMVKEMEERNERDTKKAEEVAAKLKKLEEEDMECMVCRDVIQNPQLLQCGHSVCYGCLRSWWTRPPARDDGEEIIDTEAESDTGGEGIAREEPNPAAEDPDANPEPRPRRRHRFPSAVNRKKICPYCTKEVTCRPVPDRNLRDIIETLKKELAPVPPHTQAQREAPSTRRSDLWHGIFHPENPSAEPILVTPHEHQLGRPPPPHPDPILNQFAQAQYRQRVEEEVAQRERDRARAYEDGRQRGILETQMRLDRVQQARQAALDRALQERAAALRNPPPVPQEAPGGGVADVVQIPQDPVPAPPDDAAAAL